MSKATRFIRSFSVGTLLLLLSVVSLSAQDKPLLAVPNISAVEVSETLASTCRNMVETALLKTGRYTVLSYTDIKDILAAQAFSLSGCTSDSCAIQIGELLAADNIVVGEVSRVGEGTVLSIRLVNVTSGRTLNAEVKRIEDLSRLQDAVFEAAYALAGLKYAGGAAVTETGGLFVTAPEGKTLEVFLDGESKGSAPVLVENVPFGVHLLEARGEEYLYSAEISVVSKEIMEISADVALLKGNLFIACVPGDASGYELLLDGALVSKGLIRDVPVGLRAVRVSGGGWFYAGAVTVETGKTARLTAVLVPGGLLSIAGPEGASVSLAGPDGAVLEIPANAQTGAPVGTWEYTVSHPDFVTVSGSVIVERGQAAELRPPYVHNGAWEIRQRIAAAEKRLDTARRGRQPQTVFAYILGGIGGTALASALTAEILIQYHLDNIETKTPLFEAATDTDLIEELGRSIDSSIALIDTSLRGLRNWSLVAGGAGIAGGALTLLLRPDIPKLEARLEYLRAELAAETAETAGETGAAAGTGETAEEAAR